MCFLQHHHKDWTYHYWSLQELQRQLLMTDNFGFPKMLPPHSFSFQTVKWTKCGICTLQGLYAAGLIPLLVILNNYFMSMFWSELILLKIPFPWLVWAGNRQTVMQSTCVLNNVFPVIEIMFLCICFSTLHRFEILILTQEAWHKIFLSFMQAFCQNTYSQVTYFAKEPETMSNLLSSD